MMFVKLFIYILVAFTYILHNFSKICFILYYLIGSLLPVWVQGCTGVE